MRLGLGQVGCGAPIGGGKPRFPDRWLTHSPQPQGGELLDDAEVAPRGLRKRYAAEFDFWKTDVKNHPHSAPAAWRIVRRHFADFTFKEEPWRIRLAEVILVNAALVAFE